jgi:hypothetical protein
MPLVNSPTLTPRKLAANRANAQLSHGAITAEGLILPRHSHIRHGLHVRENETLPQSHWALLAQRGRGLGYSWFSINSRRHPSPLEFF